MLQSLNVSACFLYIRQEKNACIENEQYSHGFLTCCVTSIFAVGTCLRAVSLYVKLLPEAYIYAVIYVLSI